MPKNSNRGHSGSLNVFTNQKNARGYPLIESENYRKSLIVPKKKQKNQTKKNLWSRIYFWKHKKICGLVRELNPQSPASQKIS